MARRSRSWWRISPLAGILLGGGPDVLVEHRNRVMLPMAQVGIAMLAPLAINDFVRGLYAMAWAATLLITVLAIDVVALRLGKEPPIPYPWLLLPIIGSVAATLKTQGMVGALWCYPAALFFHFVLTWRPAVLCSGALLAVALPFVAHSEGGLLALRFAFSFSLTVAVTNILLRVIRDLQVQLIDQATTDPLTRAYNRRHLETLLGGAGHQKGRRWADASLLLIDIDHFKPINDELGHEAGDEALRRMVQLLRARVRSSDLLFRMGGEEFLLLLPETREEDALIVAENLRHAVAESTLVGDRTVTVSVGVAGARAGESPEIWIQAADRALYTAKRQGRNRSVLRGDADTQGRFAETTGRAKQHDPENAEPVQTATRPEPEKH
jgi:diguanylate cyclase (GGDEF)-like protein